MINALFARKTEAWHGYASLVSDLKAQPWQEMFIVGSRRVL